MVSKVAETRRNSINDLNLSLGKKTRLHRILYEHGPGKGMALILPIDHGLEHGPKDFFSNPASKDPAYQLKLAKEGRFSAIVFHIGIAEKYMSEFAGEVPLILKLNGKTSVPPETEAFSPLTASVEDAVRLGADAVGYTLYVGSPSQDRDFAQLSIVRAASQKYGMPLMIWAYPRGAAIDAKGGRDSFYAIDYAARVASELGADMVKINMPKYEPEKSQLYPEPYRSLKLSSEETLESVIKSAGRTLVFLSGGEKVGDEELLEKARLSFAAGARGLVFGRNLWQRPFEDALRVAREIRNTMSEFSF